MTEPKKPADRSARARRQRQDELEASLKSRAQNSTSSEDDATAVLSVEEFVAQAKTNPVPNDPQEMGMSVMPPDELLVNGGMDGEDATMMLEVPAVPAASEPQPVSGATNDLPATDEDPAEASEDATVMMSSGDIKAAVAALQPTTPAEETGERTRMLPAGEEVLPEAAPRESTDMLPNATEVVEPSSVLQGLVSQEDGEEVVSFPVGLLEEADPVAASGDGATRQSLPVMEQDDAAGAARVVQKPSPAVGTSAEVKGVLTVLSGPERNQRFLIGRGITYVGRSHDCQVVLRDMAASRQHFRVETHEGRTRLIDMGSENGTLVNGERVDEHTLNRGDRVTVGATVLHFGYQDDPPPTLASPRGDDDRSVWGLIAIIAGIALGLATVTVAGGQWAGWWNVLGDNASEVRGRKAGASNNAEESESIDDDETAATEKAEETATADNPPPADGLKDPATSTDKAPVDKPEEPIVAEPETVPTAVDPAPFVATCRKQLQAGSLTEAMDTLIQAKLAGADETTVTALSEKIRVAMEDKARIEQVQQAVREERWDEGLKEAASLSPDSVFAATAQSLIQQLQAGRLASRIGAVSIMIEKKEWAPATALLDPLLEEHPDDGRVQELQRVLAAQKAADATAKDEGPATADASAQDERPAKVFEAGSVYRLYGRGDFDAARRRSLRAASDPTLSAVEQGRAAKLGRSIRKFAKEYTAGMGAVQSGRLSAAVGSLKTALRLDRGINRTYQRRIKDALGDAYSAIASRAARGNRNYEAVKAARDALKYTPGSGASRGVMATVDQRVSGMISQGKAAADAGRRGPAKRKLKEVLLILKVLKKRDERLAKAKALLKEL